MPPIVGTCTPPGAGGKDWERRAGSARNRKDEPRNAAGSGARAAARIVNAPAAVALITAGVGGGSLYLAGHTHGGYVERGLKDCGTRNGVGAAAAGALVALTLAASFASAKK